MDMYPEKEASSIFVSLVRDTYSESDEKFLNSIDCILLGRKSYEQFVSVWPGRPVDTELLARKMNTSQKIVFSSTLREAPWGSWDKALIERRDPIEAIRQLKSTEGGAIVVWASISLAQQIINEHLADEYHLYLCPALTGGGRRLFPGDNDAVTLQLIETRSCKNGVVFLNYKPKK